MQYACPRRTPGPPGIRHLGIATQTETGLVVPVVRHAETLGVAQLGEAIHDVSRRARAGHLRPDEVSGSTFTITSAGRMAGQWSTPLLNLPGVVIPTSPRFRRCPRSVTPSSGLRQE